ncbi:MarR family winged helix-turn-helix transcriptional regulator [Streptomyces kanamyceticus]|uniref:MarR family transcriptional regulator n=1 Tax=Streptomyces kanamyceticus TaxID=1967 RepID=A0A5J6GM22_STRKN|nr:MarR family transcriptional regulator [Streptomyces kanamyceticus]QEU95015.1 MarR family transcriptional regulator [Streptomyces kanamyceticus]
MATGEDPQQQQRAEVVERLNTAGRESSAVTVMFHSAVAARQGLGATETKTLDLLQREGPLTAKELAERTALAPASVTGLVDRLEGKGFVRRVKHPTDKRRVLIEIRQERLTDLEETFADWAREVGELYEEFTTGELETITRFLAGATERQRRAAARLADG